MGTDMISMKFQAVQTQNTIIEKQSCGHALTLLAHTLSSIEEAIQGCRWHKESLNFTKTEEEKPWLCVECFCISKCCYLG